MSNRNTARPRISAVRTATLAVLCCVVASLTFGAIAGAAPYAPLETTFGKGVIGTSYGVATDQSSGDVYVAATGYVPGEVGGINVFDLEGARLSPPSPFATQNGAGRVSGVAVDPITGDIDAIQAQEERIAIFGPSGSLISEFSVAGSATCLNSTQTFPECGVFEQKGTFSQIATDSAGDIYFANPVTNRVEKFSAAGLLERTIEGQAVGAFNEPRGVAVDSEGNVYVADAGNGRVVRAEYGSGAQTVIDSDGAQTVAVDPSTNDVFVGEYSENQHCDVPSQPCYHIVEYSPIGVALEDFGAGVIGVNRLRLAANTLAVNPTTHDVYVNDSQNQEVWTFTQTPVVKPPTATIEPASDITASSAKLNGQTNPNGDETTYHFEYIDEAAYNPAASDPYEVPGGSPPSVGGVVPVPGASVGEGTQEVAVNQVISGLEGDTTYHFRLVATDHEAKTRDSSDETFETPRAPPSVSTGAVSSISATAATVVGTINPERLETAYHYEYGTTIAYEQSTPTVSAGAGALGTPIPVALGDLAPDTLYHYRLVAINDAGGSYGEDETFATPGGATPSGVTRSAIGVTANTATISGTIEAEGLPTNYGFEVGTEAGNYGPPTGFSFIGPGFGEVAVTLALQNLQPGTTYHYRVVASNLYGTSTGADQSFTTPGIPSPLSQPPTAPAIATPAIAFPTEPSNAATTVKTLTKAQKPRACAREKRRTVRARCERAARAIFGGKRRK